MSTDLMRRRFDVLLFCTARHHAFQRSGHAVVSGENAIDLSFPQQKGTFVLLTMQIDCLDPTTKLEPPETELYYYGVRCFVLCSRMTSLVFAFAPNIRTTSSYNYFYLTPINVPRYMVENRKY